MSYIECQPCDNYKPKPDYYDELYNIHQCYLCKTGTVKFCYNCHWDHHTNGYETCSPAQTCLRNHPICMARWQAYNQQRAGIPIGEFI